LPQWRQLPVEEIFMRKLKVSQIRAFSLTELVAVLGIVGMMGAAVAPRITRPSECWQVQVDEHFRASIGTAVERYYVETGRWPATDLSDLGNDAAYFPDGIPANPLTGKTYRLNPDTYRVE
jgi:general secretion pathway protein G